MSEPLVRVRDVSRTVGRTRILAPTSLDVPAGRCTALVGPNGSGKTTLLGIVLGRDLPSTGSVELARELCGGRAVASMTGRAAFYAQLTVLDHLRFVGAAWGRDAGPEAGAAMLDRFGIGHVAGSFPGELSSGEEQLVGLALVLVRPARLLVLDEPEQRLDQGRKDRVCEALAERKREGVGILMATHDPAFREGLADETCALAGR